MKRNSNLELLRIVCILMILVLHYNNTRFGGALGNVKNGTLNYYLIRYSFTYG